MTGGTIERPDSGARPVHGRVFSIAASIIALILVIQCLMIGFGFWLQHSNITSPDALEIAAVQNPASPSDVTVTAASPAVPDPPVAHSTAITPSISSESSSIFTPVAPPLIPPVAAANTSNPSFVTTLPSPPLQTKEENKHAQSVLPSAAEGKETPQGLHGTLFSELAVIARQNAISDSILERLMITGSELRESGNMHGALNAYREVDKGLPNNPRVLSEIAATLDKMGLKERAAGCWEQVEAMNPLVAGHYLDLAKRQLHGEPAAALAAEPSVKDDAGTKDSADEKEVKIGEIQVTEQASPVDGQQISLKIVIDADSEKNPTAADLKLTVHFFDQGSSGEILPTSATISYLYPTEPYDWQIDGTETIIVNYQQSPLSEEQERERNGNGKYYGYTVELYYRDRLQDRVAMPENLADIKLTPVESAVPVIAPNNALFPTPPPP